MTTELYHCFKPGDIHITPGMSNLKKDLVDLIDGGKKLILLYGPEGTAKSSLAQYVGKIKNLNTMLVNCAAVWEFDKPRMGLKQIMTDSDSYDLIILDEIDAFSIDRKNKKMQNDELYPMVLMCMNFLSRLKSANKIVIATTNCRSLLDGAVKRRLEKMFVCLLDYEDRESLLLEYYETKKKPNHLHKVVELCEGYEADKMFRFLERVDTSTKGKGFPRLEVFKEARAIVKPTMTKDEIDNYKKEHEKDG